MVCVAAEQSFFSVVLFREETDDTLCTARACWAAGCGVEAEDREGDLDSFTEDKEAFEFPLTNEDKEEDTEEVCWADVSSEEVQEEEDGR